MDKWEYLIVRLEKMPSGLETPRFVNGQEIPNWNHPNLLLHEYLDSYGEKGWELVSCYTEIRSLIFKRPKQPQP